MRKILLGTTAMVAAGFVAGPAQAADPISLQLGGYYRVAYYGIFDQSDNDACDGIAGCTLQTASSRATAQTGVLANGTVTAAEAGYDRNSTAFTTDGEVHFTGSTTLDNGIGVAVQIELEVMDGSSAATSTQDVMDEHYITLSGGFGSVRIGVEDTIGNSYSTTAPVGASLFGVNSPGFVASNIGGVGPGSNTTILTLGGDAASIRYETPSFVGFRMGFSYTPDASDGQNNQEADQGQDGTTTKSDRLGALYGVAAAYSGTFGDIGVNWSASAAYGENDDDKSQRANCGGNANVPFGGCGDQWEWQTGLNVSLFGFAVGGSFRHGQNVGAVHGDTADVWDAGVSYNTGPVTVGLSMSRGSYNSRGVSAAAEALGAFDGAFNDGNVFVGGTGAGTLTVVQLGATYALGPGVSLQGAVTWDEFDSRRAAQDASVLNEGAGDARAVTNADYRSWSGGLALGLSF